MNGDAGEEVSQNSQSINGQDRQSFNIRIKKDVHPLRMSMDIKKRISPYRKTNRKSKVNEHRYKLIRTSQVNKERGSLKFVPKMTLMVSHIQH